MNRYFEKRLGLPDEETKVWKKYIKHTYSLGASTDISFSQLFIFPSINAIHPLAQYFKEFTPSI